jgi:hypothetical protein
VALGIGGEVGVAAAAAAVRSGARIMADGVDRRAGRLKREGADLSGTPAAWPARCPSRQWRRCEGTSPRWLIMSITLLRCAAAMPSPSSSSVCSAWVKSASVSMYRTTGIILVSKLSYVMLIESKIPLFFIEFS